MIAPVVYVSLLRQPNVARLFAESEDDAVWQDRRAEGLGGYEGEPRSMDVVDGERLSERPFGCDRQRPHR